jgi:hypothetical protein
LVTKNDTPENDEVAVGLGDELPVGLGDELPVGLGDELTVGLGDELTVGLGDELAVGPGDDPDDVTVKVCRPTSERVFAATSTVVTSPAAGTLNSTRNDPVASVLKEPTCWPLKASVPFDRPANWLPSATTTAPGAPEFGDRLRVGEFDAAFAAPHDITSTIMSKEATTEVT